MLVKSTDFYLNYTTKLWKQIYCLSLVSYCTKVIFDGDYNLVTIWVCTGALTAEGQENFTFLTQ